MYVRGLELVDFRSYSRVVVELEPGPCVLVGPNGVGKTNLVEALAYVATLSSHRVATDTPLVRFGATRAVVRCAIIHDERELLVELSIEPGKANRARLGRANVTSARDVLGALKLVMFAPEDLSLVRGDPSERRRYLDDLLVSRQPRFAGVRADYDRVLKQRNALLRSSYLARKTGGNRGGDLSTLDVWDTHLAQHGAKLLAARLALTASLAPHIARAYDAVSAGHADARITYSPSWTPTSPVDNPKSFKSSTFTATAATPMDAPPRTVAGAIHNPSSPVDNPTPDATAAPTGATPVHGPAADTGARGATDGSDADGRERGTGGGSGTVGGSGAGGGIGGVSGSGGTGGIRTVGGVPTGVDEIEAALLAALAEARQSEVERGVTLVGPHRDDLVLTLGELPAKGYASHGESWSFALALRLASYDLLRADGIEPVLVLDDVFAELDAGRRDRLAALVSTASQVIVTCAVDADVPRALRGARYEVGGGEVNLVG